MNKMTIQILECDSRTAQETLHMKYLNARFIISLDTRTRKYPQVVSQYLSMKRVLLQVNVDIIIRSTIKLRYARGHSNSNNTTGHLHVPRCLPALLLLAVAVVNWGPV